MASIRKEIPIRSPPEEVWAAVRDFGAVHQRLCPGVLVNARMDGDARVVTFANGLVVRELLVDVDDEARRLAYAAVGGRTTHHNGSMQVVADGARGCRILWAIDFLPNDLSATIAALVEQGAQAMKRTLERDLTGSR